MQHMIPESEERKKRPRKKTKYIIGKANGRDGCGGRNDGRAATGVTVMGHVRARVHGARGLQKGAGSS